MEAVQAGMTNERARRAGRRAERAIENMVVKRREAAYRNSWKSGELSDGGCRVALGRQLRGSGGPNLNCEIRISSSLVSFKRFFRT